MYKFWYILLCTCLYVQAYIQIPTCEVFSEHFESCIHHTCLYSWALACVFPNNRDVLQYNHTTVITPQKIHHRYDICNLSFFTSKWANNVLYSNFSSSQVPLWDQVWHLFVVSLSSCLIGSISIACLCLLQHSYFKRIQFSIPTFFLVECFSVLHLSDISSWFGLSWVFLAIILHEWCYILRVSHLEAHGVRLPSLVILILITLSIFPLYSCYFSLVSNNQSVRRHF